MGGIEPPYYTSTAILSTAAILSLFYIISKACYYLCFHKLSSHHGPFFARVSSMPNWYHAVKGDRHKWIHQLHCQYGSRAPCPTVRFAPDSVSFNTVEALDSIYRSRKAPTIKSDWYQCVRDSAGGFESTFTARQKPRHAVKRRLLSHAFSDRALRDYEPRIGRLINTWLGRLEIEVKDGNDCLDLGDWCNYLFLDILGDLAFGSSFGFTTNTEDRSIAGLVAKATGHWYSLGYHPLTKWLRYTVYKTRHGALLGGQAFRHNARLRTFCLGKLKDRRQKDAQADAQEKEDTNDMFGHLLSGRDPETGEGYSTGDLACESVLLLVAGSQSTAGGLSAVLFYLAHHPAKLARLRAEIHGSFVSQEEIRYSPEGKLASLPYLRACINESLRLSPPTPGHLPRTVVGDQGLTIDGRWYPSNTNIGVSPYSIHRNTKYFTNPFDFLPERWLEGEEILMRISPAFAAFSTGETGCIGQRLATMELCLAIARFLWQFDLRIQSEREQLPVEYPMKDKFIGQGDGPRLWLVLCPPAKPQSQK
ncbi:hypothetical protein ACJZ2D_016436 [Fusarium nematophilum]